MKHTVREVMAPAVVVAKPSDILGGIREVMDAHDIHSLPIVDDEDQLIGMITASDLVPGFSAKIPVSRIMSTKVYTVTPDTDVATAAQMMREYRIHHVVVTAGNKVVGVLSSFDLLRLIAEP
jgi:CBS domain-containing protein